MIRIFYDNDLNVLNTWMFDKEPYTASEMKSKLGIENCNHKDFEITLAGAVSSYSLNNNLELSINYKEDPLVYNPDTLITWALQQLFAETLIPHMATFLDFANKATETSKTNFLAYANAVGLTDIANTIINKAIKLGAKITNGE